MTSDKPTEYQLRDAARNSPEIVALAYAIRDARSFDDVVLLVANYDYQRSIQVEQLKQQVIEEMQWSVRPMRAGTANTEGKP